ncbi:MAG TPA: class E sortase [Rubrobacter sp.]|nr:class E sortase [Rubrobacter sp.]
MGKRSDRRKFRRRRRWAGFILLVSLTLIVFGLFALTREESTSAQTSASRSDLVERVKSPDVADAPEAASEQMEEKASVLASEEDKKSAAEKKEVNKEAAQKADEKKAAAKEVAQKPEKKPAPKPPAIPTPPTNDLWMSVPALGLYDNYVTNTNAHSALDYGAIKLPESGFPWQPNSNTYIAAHRLGWPGTGSDHQFYNLPLLQYGDKIYLGDANGTTYTYEVTEFHEITPDERWITGPQAGRDMVSLQTCIENYGDYWTMGPNWYVRYVVQADRVSVDVAK